MQVDIVTPEKQLISAEVTSVEIPGMDGDMTIMGDHAPLITTLRPGVVSVASGEGVAEYVVTGGFLEISPEGATLLAETALPRNEVNRELIEAALEEAKQDLEIAPAELKAAAALRVNDMGVLLELF